MNFCVLFTLDTRVVENSWRELKRRKIFELFNKGGRNVEKKMAIKKLTKVQEGILPKKLF